MLKTILCGLIIFPLISFAQPKIIHQAIIKATINILSENYMEKPGDGQIKTVTFIKNNKVKTEFGPAKNRFAIYEDYDRRLTTKITFGEDSKIGFVESFDADSNLDVKNLDSTNKIRTNNRYNGKYLNCPSFINTVISYSDETKNIAGYECKKALIRDVEFPDWDPIIVWYTSDIKFKNCYASSTGYNLKGKGRKGNDGFEKINGFVMGFIKTFDTARKIIVNVTEIATGRDITNQEVSVPGDYVLKPNAESINIMNDLIDGRIKLKKGKLIKK